LDAEMRGCDYNPYLIDWCRETLPWARFVVNERRPPLDFEDDQFDLIYVYSVFSHFDVEAQLSWMGELTRVARPGGVILITVPGERWTHLLSAGGRERFAAGQPVIVTPDQSGTSFCSALSPEPHIRKTLARGLE